MNKLVRHLYDFHASWIIRDDQTLPYNASGSEWKDWFVVKVAAS